MTSQVDGNGQPCDVRRLHLDVDGERGGPAAEALRPDAETVDALQQIAFELGEIGPRVTSIDRPQYRTLGKQRRSVERPADAHADDDRRTRVGAGAIDCFDDEVADALDSVRR